MSSNSSSSSEEEWEDVECLPVGGSSREDDRSSKTAALEILVSAKSSSQRGRKKNVLEKAVAAYNRDLRHSLHKASLLCLLVQGLQISSHCNDPLLQARLFSLVPRELLWISSEKLNRLLKWFVARKDHLLAVINDIESSSNPDNASENKEGSEIGHKLSATEMLVAILRVFGLRARLVLALNPLPLKPSREQQSVSQVTSPDFKSPLSEAQNSQLLKEPAELSPTGQSNPLPSARFLKLMQQLKQSSGINSVDPGCDVTLGERGDGGRCHSASTRETGRGGRKRRGGKTVRSSTVKKRKISSQTSVDADTPEKELQASSEGKKNSRTARSKGKGKRPARKNETLSTASETSPYFGQKKVDSDSGDECGVSGSDDSDFIPVKRKSLQRLTFDSSDSSCSDMEGDGVSGDGVSGKGGNVGGGGGDKGRGKKKTQQTARGKVVKGQPQNNQKLKDKTLESRDQKRKEDTTTQCGMYDEKSSWAEVFVEDQKRYVCLHLHSSSVDLPKMCERHCPHRMSYIIAIENGEFTPHVSDVTARYASEWCTATRKLRLNEWWQETLQPYASSKADREMEDEDIMNILYSHPMPTSINDYKSHPLYALRRHLLKFEAIYPPDSTILGYCKGEPVYSRSCVFTLHTRETWLKEGRVVKKDEQPYKVVKARPKKGQSSLERETSTVEVFGKWQTEVYVPPPVVDGIVPRNEYGNVELFQPSMLPAGACHIKIPGIHKVARKLEISYAPAMMGWDFHSGHCCPVIEGIVVAQENEEVLLEAWRQEEQIIIEKQMKKRESRVLERWKKMTRCVLIRERVRRTYSLI